MKKNNDNNTGNNKKSSKRKFLAATLGALIVVNIISVCDFSVVDFGNFSANLSAPDSITMNIDEVDQETITELENRLREGIANFNNVVAINDLAISSDIGITLVREFLDKNPEYSYVRYGIGGGKFNGDANIIYCKNVKLVYNASNEEIMNDIAMVDEYADNIIAKTGDMTTLEKALYVHDRLALDFKYDERIHSSDSAVKNETNYDIYSLVKEKTGVCQAYAGLYKYILDNKLGIPAVIVTSNAMGHAWNAVQIDGNWYHTDVTWDDPEPDRKGNVHHQYFLLSDSQIQSLEKNHFDWNFYRGEAVECSSTLYDSSWWSDVCTEIFRISGKWFSINSDGSFLERDIQSGEIVADQEPSFTVERDTWYYWNSDVVYWKGNYTTLVNNGDEFFYNTCENVYSINMDGSNKRLIASFPKAEHNGYQIYSLAVDDDNMLYVNLQNNPHDFKDSDGNVVPLEVEKHIIADVSTASASGIPVEDVKKNETNDDGSFNWSEIKSTLDLNQSVAIENPEEVKVLPADVVENVKGKDLDIVINMDTYKWIINGMDVSDNEIADVALGVSQNQGIIPDEINDMYSDDQEQIEVNLEHEGQFGYDATLSLYVGEEYSGKTASILHYDEENSRLDYVESVEVGINGYANFTVSHASSYMVFIDEKAVGLPGDIDNNGTFNLKDFLVYKQYLVGKITDVSNIKIANADMNADNNLTITDGILFGKQLLNTK